MCVMIPFEDAFTIKSPIKNPPTIVFNLGLGSNLWSDRMEEKDCRKREGRLPLLQKCQGVNYILLLCIVYKTILGPPIYFASVFCFSNKVCRKKPQQFQFSVVRASHPTWSLVWPSYSCVQWCTYFA